MSPGNCPTAASGTAIMTKSCARAACSTVAAAAPVSAATAANEAGPRELAINTSWPSAVRWRARVLPMLPEPIIPTFIFFSIATYRAQAASRNCTRAKRVGQEPMKQLLPVALLGVYLNPDKIEHEIRQQQ